MWPFEGSHAKHKTLRTASSLDTNSRYCASQPHLPRCVPQVPRGCVECRDPAREVGCYGIKTKLRKVVQSLPTCWSAQLLPCHAVPCLGASSPVGYHTPEKQQAEASCIGLLTMSTSVLFCPSVLFFCLLLHLPLYIHSQLKNKSVTLQAKETFVP